MKVAGRTGASLSDRNTRLVYQDLNFSAKIRLFENFKNVYCPGGWVGGWLGGLVDGS